ncbi:MAG: ABC transporter ATP-binding protein [Patescibacteria group bacterium]|nr:ABC transporter ATP-binding protein [Patescibacteria group bacterium]
MIQIKNITKVYKTGTTDTVVLNNVSFHVESGDYVAVMGPSGSGKSTLMHILGLLDSPTSGTYELDKKNVAAFSKYELAKLRNRKIGFVFQAFNLLPRASALKNVMLPMLYGGVEEKERQKQAAALLTRIGLENRLLNTSNELSGGEMQRVAIARALAMNPDILLADEPTGNISTQQGKEIMEIFNTLNGQGHTIIIITHDALIAHYAKRIIKLQDGKIIYDGKRRGIL